MLQRRFIHLFRTLVGIAFFDRNKHNSGVFWKRLLIFIPWYTLGVILAVLDLIFLGYWFTLIMRFTQRNGRKLSKEELELFSGIPNDKYYLQRVFVFEESWLARSGARMNRRASLGLGIANTVHFTRKIDISHDYDRRWLVHEIAHTLQFKYRGLIYIPEALIAQQFSGYDFGGKETLSSAKKLRVFNPEQQADMFVVMQLSNFESEIRQEIEKGNW